MSGRHRHGVAAMLALAILAVPGQAGAAFPGSNGKIAYNTSGTGIYTINPDGSGNSNIVSTGAPRNAVWSSDGTRIAYVQNQAIGIVAADGTGLQVVCTQCTETALTNTAAMTWSPDGTQFAYTKQITTNQYEIYRINADGTGEIALTTAGDNRTPAWSPDGTKIAFWSRRTSGIWVMNSDGTGQTALGPGNLDRPSWSPDGTKIAFSDLGGIWTMNANGTNPTQLTAANPRNIVDRNPAWSPDGRQIVFRGWTNAEFGEGLVTINTDGTERTNIPGASGNRLPDWQPTPPSYPRPKSATPMRVSLVPAAQQCTSPNRTHGPPLAFGSCNPPQRASSYLTVGTPDANGRPAASTGTLKASVVAGTPGTPTDEADVLLSLSLTDVRLASDLTDYAGELSARFALRRTDKESQPFNSTPATLIDLTLSFDAVCTATAGPEGASCAVQTSADALVPFTVQESRRAIWELGQAQVFDGGADGDTATADNTLFAVSGVFIP